MLRKGILTMVAVLLLMQTGCSSQSSSSASSYKQETMEMAVEESSFIADSMPEIMPDSMTQNQTIIDTTIDLNRKMIKTGYLDIETKTFDETNREINEQIKSLGGFTQNETIYGNREENYSNRTREMTIRIPQEHFDTFINTANVYGNVTRTSVTNEDVTDAYVDIEIRLETLMIQKERLQELLTQAGELKDLFEIENELANVTYEIEKLKGSLNQYDSLINYSTLNLYIKETIEYKEVQEQSPTLLGRVQNQFRSSINLLIDLSEGLLLFAVAITPFLFILGIMSLIVFLIVKKLRRKK